MHAAIPASILCELRLIFQTLDRDLRRNNLQAEQSELPDDDGKNQTQLSPKRELVVPVLPCDQESSVEEGSEHAVKTHNVESGLDGTDDDDDDELFLQGRSRGIKMVSANRTRRAGIGDTRTAGSEELFEVFVCS